MTIHKFLDLGSQPIANGFLNQEDFEKEFFFNLGLGLDEDTCLVTQTEYVTPEKMFNDSYAYRGSLSKTMRNHFLHTKLTLSPYLPSHPKVLEIGSNDGVFVKNWNKETTVAVEPCSNFAQETNDMGYKTYPEFWTSELASQIKEENGSMDLVYAANCMCHIPNLHETFLAVKKVLSSDGLFVFEDPSLAHMINLNSYDQIYDEHAHIFSVTALSNLLEQSGLTIIRVDSLSVHGGSNRIWATHSESSRKVHKSVEDNLSFEKLLGLDSLSIYERFRDKVLDSRYDLTSLLCRCADNNKKVISYGATSKSTTIFNYCGIGPDLIHHITDTTPEKQGKYSPGVHIPIVAPGGPIEPSVDFAFLGAWNFAEEIKEKEEDFTSRGGLFITHAPVVHFV
tara:strand:- start:1826 stop:3010 length:1185 start_codon:yes stop_codon:yes gene_type:complete